ncbi:hypothetical protein SAMN02745165_01205 [Malonomonas rubra DSM 5091]|uniref:Uncharacterized protein n=1 Tax=Malonomonas rubra DSM 5091 TaxID=1122189 RepID=A0A1M6F9U3_MALRU|nr:hypothetical protein [Malonomonas rubra]SHI94508.1 hypothetical protein SAMN02745165_01205 [Malonomonas rubra DSM 5091]
MQRFEPITQDLCEQLKQDIAEALAPLAEKYGLDLATVKEFCDDDAESVAVNLRFSLPARTESVASRKEENDFRCYAEGYGMQSNWLGKEFTRGNFTYKVAGLNINLPKECVILQRSDGSRCQENGKLIARYLG